MKGDLAEFRTGVKGDLAEFRTGVKGDLARLETRLTTLEQRTFELSTHLPPLPTTAT